MSPSGEHGARVALGKLSAVNPRDVWANEALDFTPWLRQNAGLLGEALGLDIELTDVEVPVGGFNVDLVGTDVTNGRKLIVENQLEPTDHTHLGQLLTYAGGLDSAAIVWISPQFRDEHRQALDWLNAHTDESIDFFGLQLEVLRIGASEPAPSLKPASMPNEWQRRAKAATAVGVTPIMQARQRFFEVALAELKAQHPGITSASHAAAGSWLSIAAGRSGFWFTWAFSGSTCRVELNIDTGSEDDNVGLFSALLARRAELESKIGEPLTWDRKVGRRAIRIYLSRPGSEMPDADPELRAWAVATMAAFARTLRPLIRTLTPATAELALQAPDSGPPA
ncbi:MAG: DUF4268 domain-containing protein [Candidatus Limnocylindrales bacterium]|jgi:hypothetical protein